MQLFSLHICIIQPLYTHCTLQCYAYSRLPSPRPPSELEMGTSTAGWWLLQSWRHKWKKSGTAQGWSKKLKPAAFFNEIHGYSWSEWVVCWGGICICLFFFSPCIWKTYLNTWTRKNHVTRYVLYLALTIGYFDFQVHHWPNRLSAGNRCSQRKHVGAKVPVIEGGGSDKLSPQQL